MKTATFTEFPLPPESLRHESLHFLFSHLQLTVEQGRPHLITLFEQSDGFLQPVILVFHGQQLEGGRSAAISLHDLFSEESDGNQFGYVLEALKVPLRPAGFARTDGQGLCTEARLWVGPSGVELPRRCKEIHICDS